MKTWFRFGHRMAVRGFAAILIISNSVFQPVVTASQPHRETRKGGILVMAHGGSGEWNNAVEQAVAPLRSYCPVAIAFGMADRDSLQQAVTILEKEGVNRIAVVRLFISPESFKHQTEYFLGLRTDPPAENSPIAVECSPLLSPLKTSR